jgi:putative tryptophan/tyrosine transport system substrate-binding protein
MPKIGLLHTGTEESYTQEVAALISGLGAMGYWASKQPVPDGHGYTKIDIEPKWAKDNPDTLKEYADALANDAEVQVIVAGGGPQSAVAAMEKTVTNRKPVVFTTVADPVESRLVDDYARPGRNLTGMAGKTSELDPPRLLKLATVLRENSTDARKRVKVLRKKNRPKGREQYDRLADATLGTDLDLDPEDAGTVAETLALMKANAAAIHGRLVIADSFFYNNRKDVVQGAGRKAAIYQWREFVEIGGLMSFGPSIQEAYFTAGVYAGRILKGETPANIAVSVPTRFELAINVKTAADAGITIPRQLLDAADVKINGTIQRQ